MLLRGPLPIGSLGRVLGVTRQAARKVARQLHQRGYATTASDPDDARKVIVVATAQGQAYARAMVEVIASLNQTLAELVNPDQLIAADIVLRATITGEHSVLAQRIPTPARTRGR
jgi:DNA-binding MarR family transcriptional regulator